jgi:hypothetical protein
MEEKKSKKLNLFLLLQELLNQNLLYNFNIYIIQKQV